MSVRLLRFNPARVWFSVLFMILDEAARLIKDHVFYLWKRKLR